MLLRFHCWGKIMHSVSLPWEEEQEGSLTWIRTHADSTFVFAPYDLAVCPYFTAVMNGSVRCATAC